MAPGIEFSDLNWIAIAAAVAANIILGFIWYAPKVPTGKAWLKALNFPPDFKPDPKKMILAFSLMIVGAFLLMFVLQHVFLAFRDAYRLDGSRMQDGLTIGDGIQGAIFTWLGFFVPVQFSAVTFENKPWSLFFVNAGYYLVSLLIAGIIFASMM